MRGGYTLVLLALFLGAAILDLIFTCAYFSPPYFNVPRCTTFTSCLKATGLEDSPYGRAVARSWYFVNRFRDALNAREKMCTLDLNLSMIADHLWTSAKDMEQYIVLAVKYADYSNYVAFREIGYAVEDLNEKGVRCLPDQPIHEVYQRMWDTLAGVRTGRSTTTLAARLNDVLRQHRDLERLGLTAEALGPVLIPVAGVIIRWGLMTYSSLVSAANESGTPSHYFNAEEYINKSVGTYGSVYYDFSRLWEAYLQAERDLDSFAKQLKRTTSEEDKKIEKLVEDLSSYSLGGFTWERVARFAPAGAKGSILPSDPASLAVKANIAKNRYVRSARGQLRMYEYRLGGAYCALADARNYVNKLTELREELESYVNALESLRDRCLVYLRSYHPSSQYVRLHLRGYVKDLENGNLGACADGIKLIEMDENYGSMEGMLRACEDRAERYADYSCFGEISERLECCLAFLERKRKELYSSHEYVEYLKLRDAVERMLALVDSDELLLSYLRLPLYPESKKDLERALKNLLDLYRKLKRLVEQSYTPEYYFEGYLDAEQMSELNIFFSVGLGSADVEYKLELPVKVYSYRILEGQNLTVTVRGRRAYLRGGGWARVWALAYPADFDVERVGEDGGLVYMRVRYTGTVPARYPLRGDVVSKSPNVSVSNGYLYFLGPGEAVLALSALEQDWEEEGNVVRVVVRNTSQEPYTGTIFLPVEAEKLPRSCEAFGNGAICSVRLDPFETKEFVFEGVYHEENVVTSSPPEEHINEVRLEAPKLPEKNEAFSYISLLRSWYRRAEELGVAGYLSFDENILSALEAQIKETNDVAVVSALTTLLRGTVEGTKRFVRAKVAALEGIEGAEKAYSLAKQALNAKDYMLALALALAVDMEEKASMPPLLPLLLSLLGLGGVGAYIRFRPKISLPRSKRIPRI